MKVAKTCEGNTTGCISNADLIQFNGDSYDAPSKASEYSYGVVLQDGITLAFNDEGNYCIVVDIDGPNKGKNQVGNDIFQFVMAYDDSYGHEKIGQLFPGFFYYYRSEMNNYSTAWVIENGNLDYLKTTWHNDEDTLECPNGTLLDWTNHTSCH